MTSRSPQAPQIFEQEYYQRLFEIEERHWWARGMRDAMLALLSGPLPSAGQLRVLDVGCGTGYLMEFLPRHYSVDGQVIGIDLSPHALQFCALRGATQLHLASATELPFEAGSFDLLICIDTLQHLSGAGADRTALLEFARVLRPGGLLYLRTNSALGRRKLAGVDADQYRRYTHADVNHLLTATGFETVRATYLNTLPSLLGALREFLRPAPPTAHASGPGLAIRPYPAALNWLNEVMHLELALEARAIGLGFDLPFGHSAAYVARKSRG